jgi:hypothetical protein
MAHPQEDPLVRSTRREALIVLAIVISAMVWTIGYCSRHAYDRPADDIQIVFGFPDWIVWGILAPWAVCSVVSIVFAFGIMSDDPLGEAVEARDPDDGDDSGREAQNA